MATDNRPDATLAKVELRRRLLEGVRPARVLEIFCGIDGVMHADVWHEASEYLGIDRRFDVTKDARPRLVGDAYALVESADLEPWNVIDVDAYGCPWRMMTIIGERKRWRKGERYGVAITDGSQGKMRFGMMSDSAAALLGIGANTFTYRDADQLSRLHRKLLARWAHVYRLRVESAWMHVSLAGEAGSQMMIYSSAVLSGLR